MREASAGERAGRRALIVGAVLLFSAAGPPPIGPAVTSGADRPVEIRAARSVETVASAIRSLDLVTYQAPRKGTWFSVPATGLPATTRRAEATFAIGSGALANRRNGRVSPTLVSSYVFLQFGDIPVAAFEAQVPTLRALFIRTARIFVDYEHDRVISWDGTSVRIPMDVRGFVRVSNAHGLPVFLELNYSDWVPGPDGSGLDALVKADTVAGMIRYLDALAAEGLRVDGVTFGDEWDDPSDYGGRKPTRHNSDMASRFIRYATALKAHFPHLKIYAFDSYIGAARGQIDQYWEALRRIRQAEVTGKLRLLDGFTFRESYVYMDAKGRRQGSQRILDDTESLYRSAPVFRFDPQGRTYGDADRGYLPTLIATTRKIFGRSIDIGLTEYLPAIPVQLGEGDTSRYADIDFVLHYADVVGIYAQLGLDVVSSWVFGDSPQFAEAYLDRSGHRGTNYPVHEQLAKSFAGTLLNVSRSVVYDKLKVKVYAVRDGTRRFVMILNKDVSHEHTIRLTLSSQLDLTIRLPRRSYTSLSLDESGLVVSGLGS
jgi:hypothetical protein